MNTTEILRGILRRWYIVAIGLVVSVAGSVVVWNTVPPTYERSASLLLMPGADLLPEGASNPYLYLGSLSTAADILARASAEGLISDLQHEFPGAEFTIGRDYSTSAPVVSVQVEAPTDGAAAAGVDRAMAGITSTLGAMQDESNIASSERISVQTLYVDGDGTVKQRTRMTALAATGVAVMSLSVVLAALVDAMILRSRRKTARLPRRAAAGPREAEAPAGEDTEGDAMRGARNIIRDDFEALIRSQR
ncbi:hypothetical protein ET495_00085 [Xylanimonas allomyrinae]|uniref:Polysaccharide chain length determinant N-terminal domain-containing protein n=1 Tax=Xylanimonas allomyrinae TaxID=2509459 RepID=A0A4P6EHS9_9MICO|nr:hypothetical protein [Xylanimonas allomyrinae]QAY61964.1 hypothetical protein ET495_00085 [Xylanimonas allomyrinae]